MPLDYAKESKSIVNNYYSMGLTISVYVVSIMIPILSVGIWYMNNQGYLPRYFDNFGIADFLVPGLIIGYFFFFILATVDIIKKMIAKVKLDTLLKKGALDKPLIKKAKGLYWFSGVFSVLGLIMLLVGFLSNYFRILVFKPYKRTVAPPGVGPGIAEAHKFDYSK